MVGCMIALVNYAPVLKKQALQTTLNFTRHSDCFSCCQFHLSLNIFCLFFCVSVPNLNVIKERIKF